MGKKKRLKKENDKNNKEEITYSDKTEKVYKKILKTMTWIVGICFTLIIILPLFNNVTLDRFTLILFRIGILNLVVFTLFEFIGDSIKRTLQKYIDPA